MKTLEEVFSMLDKVKAFISGKPLEAAAVFLGAGAAITFLVLKFMGKIKK